MIRELRKKFILIAMLSTFIVLSAIMGTVNISGYLKMAARADDMTSVLGINDGKFPGNGKEEMEAAGNENPPDVAVGKREDIFETEASRNFSPEAPYETRYFTVILDDGGEISSCDLNHIAAVDEDMALEYGKTVSGKKSETGFCGIYRYRVIKDDGQTKCIFLDCAREISGFRVTAVSSIVMSFLGLAAVLVLVIFFSQIVFLPVEESIRLLRKSTVDYEFRTTLVRELHRPEDLDAIAAWLAGAPRYYLQNFVDSGNLIGRGYHGFTAEQLQGFAERVRPFFGAVELRGID